jgi:hypothetical protein
LEEREKKMKRREIKVQIEVQAQAYPLKQANKNEKQKEGSLIFAPFELSIGVNICDEHVKMVLQWFSVDGNELRCETDVARSAYGARRM